jgi:RNA polymerase sigma-70 factor (ECF subfamily)
LSADDPDTGLVARVGSGDDAATRMLVNAKLPRILGLARRMLGDATEAEDVAQETFLRAWRQAASWRPGAARFDTWLHSVTLNLCRDRLRRRRETLTPEVPDVADPAAAADTVLDERAKASAVQTAIEALPERQREAILLVHYQDLTNIAAVDIMDISVEALESLLARGRRSLRTVFAARDTGHD